MDKYLEKIINDMEKTGRSSLQKEHFQHGRISVFDHSINVARTSLKLAGLLGIAVNKRELARGALLHDYFLYDWHEKDKSHCLHGFRHAGTALRNARQDFSLSKTEENIISRHMFPLTPLPPLCREAWIVCIADKYCAVKETAGNIYAVKFMSRKRRKVKNS